MPFDPISAWIVALIADGINVSGTRGSGQTEYEQKCIKEGNRKLNDNIRRIHRERGVSAPYYTYQQVRNNIEFTRNSYPFSSSRGVISIDIDNQEYIVALLDACAEFCSNEGYQELAQKYKTLADQAKQEIARIKPFLEARRAQEEKEQRKQDIFTSICIVFTCLIAISLLIILTD